MAGTSPEEHQLSDRHGNRAGACFCDKLPGGTRDSGGMRVVRDDQAAIHEPRPEEPQTLERARARIDVEMDEGNPSVRCRASRARKVAFREGDTGTIPE